MARRVDHVTVSHVSAYTVVRVVRRRVNSVSWGSETPERIQLKFGNLSCVIMSTFRPHTQNTVRWPPQTEGVRWGGHMGEVVPSRDFLFFIFHFFGYFNACTAKPDKRGFLLHAPKNVFRWWCVPSGLF